MHHFFRCSVAYPTGESAALLDECQVMLAQPQAERSVQHGDAFYEAVIRVVTALDRIGRCCGNANFIANEALGRGRIAHPDLSHSGRTAP